MRIHIYGTAEEMGIKAAKFASEKLNNAIAVQGYARLLLSTGASQFEFISALIASDIDWSKVTMFHLDEYVGLPQTHRASFRKYLKERFVEKVGLKEAVYVNGEGDVLKNIVEITKELNKSPIDVAAIGIGENGHIAFNDPPADFETRESYIVVNLEERCKRQQVGEGWFPSVDDVPKSAITMSVSQILKSKCIISVVPHSGKAEAVKNTLKLDVNNMVPATILKSHPDWNLYLDKESAKLFAVMP